MRLSKKEFKAMNHPFRKFLQKYVELPCFRQMGLSLSSRHVLEIGCGSGYGAELLMTMGPESYMGIDLMPEQIALARQRNLDKCTFSVLNAADLTHIHTYNYDVIVIFGILHHIPAWRDVLIEIYRVLKPGGRFFIEEPDLGLLKIWDTLFKWGHPVESDFTLHNLETYSRQLGFTIEKKKKFLSFGFYRLLKLI